MYFVFGVNAALRGKHPPYTLHRGSLDIPTRLGIVLLSSVVLSRGHTFPLVDLVLPKARWIPSSWYSRSWMNTGCCQVSEVGKILRNVSCTPFLPKSAVVCIAQDAHVVLWRLLPTMVTGFSLVALPSLQHNSNFSKNPMVLSQHTSPVWGILTQWLWLRT